MLTVIPNPVDAAENCQAIHWSIERYLEGDGEARYHTKIDGGFPPD